MESQAPEVAIFIAATETFSRKNIGCSIPDSLARYREVADKALDAGLPVRGYISVVAGCPYEASCFSSEEGTIIGLPQTIEWRCNACLLFWILEKFLMLASAFANSQALLHIGFL